MPRKWQDKVSPSSPKLPETSFTPGDEPPSVILLVTGEDAAGQDQWAYARIAAEKYVPFKKAEEKGNYNLSDFGTILKSGKGKTPPEAVQNEMKEQYGFEEDFEEQLAHMMEEAIALWNGVLPKEEGNS